jgi:hypothetical protein
MFAATVDTRLAYQLPQRLPCLVHEAIQDSLTFVQLRVSTPIGRPRTTLQIVHSVFEIRTRKVPGGAFFLKQEGGAFFST